MKKTNEAVLRQLEGDYKRACYAWVCELARLWEMKSVSSGYWISDEVGGVFDFDGDWTLDMKDIRYAVRNGITVDQASDWKEYVCWAGENDFDQPSLQEYVEHRVPLLDREAQQRISEARRNLMEICAEEREKMLNAFLDRKNMHLDD